EWLFSFILAGRRLVRRTCSRRRDDGASGQGAHQAADDDALVACDAAEDDALRSVYELADFDLPLLDDVLVIDDQEVAAELIVPQCSVRNEDRRNVELLGDAYAHEQAGLQHYVLVLENGTGSESTGAAVDLRRYVVQRAGVRIAVFRLQADADRYGT